MPVMTDSSCTALSGSPFLHSLCNIKKQLCGTNLVKQDPSLSLGSTTSSHMTFDSFYFFNYESYCCKNKSSNKETQGIRRQRFLFTFTSSHSFFLPQMKPLLAIQHLSFQNHFYTFLSIRVCAYMYIYASMCILCLQLASNAYDLQLS